MRNPTLLLWLILLILGTPMMGWAQIDMSATLSQTTALIHEPVNVQIRIRNNTPDPIRLSADNPAATLWLVVERGPSRSVRQTTPELFRGELVIPPMQSITHTINITDAYDIRAQGPYTVRVRLSWRGQTYGAATQFFDVVPGIELSRVETDLADGSGRRLYRLITVNRNRRYDLVFRVDDPIAGINYTVTSLGSLLRVMQPQLRVDAAQNAVILHQASPARYFFHQFTPNGRLIRQRTYMSETPGVSLIQTEGGDFIVRGATASIMQR